MKQQATRKLPTLLLALCVAASGAGMAAPTDDGVPKEITIQAKKNPGDISYRAFYDLQHRLDSYLPPEPRLFDVLNRISFTGFSLAEQDAYDPPSWAVSIVGDDLDETVPIRRGGYFRLPYLEAAYRQKATVMFKDQSRRNSVDTGWILRVDDSRKLGYADFGKAMAQLKAMQAAIPLWYILNYRIEKFTRHDGLKACFLKPGGTIRIDGAPVADAGSGRCAVLKFDPARAAGGQVIEFDGALDIVTLIDTGPYLRPGA